MIDFFKNVRWSLLFIGILTVLIGVAMVMYPETASDTIVKILGGIMAVTAVISILGYLVDRARGRSAFTNLLVGALMLIMGAFLYFRPTTFVEFLQYIFAAVVLVQGINLIAEGLSSKKYESSHWGQTVLMGLICMAFAVLVFLNPLGTFKTLMIMTGIFLIIIGLMNIFVSARIGLAAHRFNKAVKEVEGGIAEEIKAIEEAEKEIETVEEAKSHAVDAEVIPEKISDVEIKTEVAEEKVENE